MARYVNWKGERKQKCKRGFATKKEAQEWERMFQLQNSSDLDMSLSLIHIYDAVGHDVTAVGGFGAEDADGGKTHDVSLFVFQCDHYLV